MFPPPCLKDVLQLAKAPLPGICGFCQEFHISFAYYSLKGRKPLKNHSVFVFDSVAFCICSFHHTLEKNTERFLLFPKPILPKEEGAPQPLLLQLSSYTVTCLLKPDNDAEAQPDNVANGIDQVIRSL